MIHLAWQVGARFVCTKCWLRSTAATCGRCGDGGLDVGGAGGFSVLLGRWKSHGAFVRGRSMLSPLAAHRLPVVAGLSVAMAVACAAAPIIGFAAKGTKDPALLALAAMGGVVCAPLVALFFGAFLVLYGNVCRLLAALVALVPTPLGIGRREVKLVTAIFDFIARLLLSPIAVSEPPRRRATDAAAVAIERGALLEPLTVHLRRDALSFSERFDAWLDGPLVVRIGDSNRRVDFPCGEVVIDPRCGERRPDGSAPPRWAEAPGRTGVARLAVLPAGTRVVLSPGRVSFS